MLGVLTLMVVVPLYAFVTVGTGPDVHLLHLAALLVCAAAAMATRSLRLAGSRRIS
ncbi:hypothetical protein [Motilibacter peucedani]|uniref:hypothetical protein n=1 Tax=Motilibacter peucedani TaxID=598650 RepID=UPI001600E05E|nr:hypothetical protein [Motilibacter peucedani]